MRSFLILLCAASLLLSACSVPSAPDTIYTNGAIWTGASDHPWAEALAITDGQLVAVGDATTVEALQGTSTEVVDVEGHFVVPGFIDNHTHFMNGGFQLASVDLRSADSPEEFAQRIGAFAETLPEERWILNGDWDHEAWGGTLPERSWIDDLTPYHPVLVNRLDGHMALANTKALALAGVTAATPDPPGGTIVRDANGEPTGVLKDEAMTLVYQVVPERSEAELDEALQRAMDHAVSLGVTQVHDMGTWTHWSTYRRAAAAGHLKLRLYSFVPLATWARLDSVVAAEGQGDAWLRWGGLKGFVDGSLGSTTAWFYEPYTDEPQTAGLLVTDTTALRTAVVAADAADLHVAVHAIGDRANDWLLDVFAEADHQNGSRDRRFRIEHAQHLSREALARFHAQGVIPSMQPFHAIDDGRWAEKRIGPERILTTYAFRSLLDADAPLTFGSDWTVAPLSPLQGIAAAVLRQTIDGANPDGWVPEEKISVEQALRAYTANNAYAGFQEDILGTLEIGKRADFVVLSANLLTIDPARIAEVEVLRTVIDGHTQFLTN